ncbi:MAG: GspE/PulE family protein [Lentisphaerales bacterium]|nr:GspE/PulE family protein [Lentisphaerales bacterium]
MEEAVNGQEEMNSILERLKASERFDDAMWELEGELLDAFSAERFTIYQKDANDSEIVSWYRTSNDSVQEVRVPISPASIAGYCAMSQQAFVVDDAYDTDYLESLNQELQFDHSYDGASGYLTEAMVVVPIVHHEKLYGVLQVINNVEGGPFEDDTYYKAVQLAEVISESFRYELRTSSGPYDLIVQSGRINLEQLDLAEDKAASEKVPLSHALRTMFDLTAEEIGECLSTYYQVPFHSHDENLILDEELMGNLNISFLASNHWVPLSNTGDRATILISDPNNHELVMEIQNIVKAMNYEFHVGLGEDILRYLGLDPSGAQVKSLSIADIDNLLEDGGDTNELTEEAGEALSEDLDSDEESKIIQLVNKIIIRAVQEGSSDIHIEPMKGKTPGEVRMRVDGVCRKVFDIPASLMRPVVARIKVLSNLDIAERRKPQDGKMAVRLKGKPLELRVATLPVVNGESAVLRILAGGGALPFEKLMFSERNAEAIHNMIAHPHGIVLVVGPTGSGKTTTLHAILAVLNTEERKILTAEDPVEITQNGLQQVQVLPKAGLTFAAALRSFLRCDPDVILIGEMRDEETAGSGIEASLTGHLVFSTLHTNSAPETIIRLLDIGLDPMNFADALVGIVAQRLIRTLCKCKQPYRPDQEEIDKLVHFYGEEYIDELNLNFDELELYKPNGCDKCGHTGYKGRMGIHEALDGTAAMKKLVAKAATVPEIRDQAVKDGMRTLQQDGIAKIFMGHTDLVQVRKVAF